MSADDFTDEGFAPAPPAQEAPEGDVELALQAEALDSDAVAPAEAPPPVVGRTWQLDLETGRFLPVGRNPTAIRGSAAMRQAVEKALRTDRGSSPVQGPDYGMEDAERQIEGQPFDAAEFAATEERIRDCLLALPWVLEIQNFDADGSPDSSTVYVTFRVVPEGDQEPIDFDRYPLPTP